MSERRDAGNETRQLLAQAARLYPPAPWLTWAALACLVVGLIVFIIGLIVSPGQAWGSFLANFLFWAGIAAGAVVTAAVYDLSPAIWGHVVQRISLGLAAFLPFPPLLLVPLWFGRHYLYDWANAPVGNRVWLNWPVLFVRDELILILTGALSLWFVCLSLRRDVGAHREAREAGGRFAAWLTSGWRGDEEERRRSSRIMHNLAPAIVLTYAFGYSILAIDLAMSLDPHFHSTMYPGIYFLGQFFAALALTTVLVALWRRRAPLGGIILPRYSQDLGNLTFAFALFWAYVSWSQYIVIWMANLPHEAGYFSERFRVPPWKPFAWIGIFADFLIPFVVLPSRWVKQRPPWLAVIGGIGVAGMLLWRFLDVLPFLAVPGPSTFGLVPLGTTLGFLGGVALPYLWLMRRVPLFPVEDPLFFQAVAVRNVEV